MAGKNYLKRMDFGNEAADDVDDEELKSYFVMQEGFENFLKENKAIEISLGKRILRAETAAIVVCGIIANFYI